MLLQAKAEQAEDKGIVRIGSPKGVVHMAKIVTLPMFLQSKDKEKVVAAAKGKASATQRVKEDQVHRGVGKAMEKAARVKAAAKERRKAVQHQNHREES